MFKFYAEKWICNVYFVWPFYPPINDKHSLIHHYMRVLQYRPALACLCSCSDFCRWILIVGEYYCRSFHMKRYACWKALYYTKVLMYEYEGAPTRTYEFVTVKLNAEIADMAHIIDLLPGMRTVYRTSTSRHVGLCRVW